MKKAKTDGIQTCKRGHSRGRGVDGHCLDCKLLNDRKWKNTEEGRQKHQLYARNYNLIKRYGITEEDYQNMYKSQDGCCAICRKHASSFKTRLNVDHNHKTGKIRGLLCYRCNKFLVGRLNYETALKVLNYLEIENKKAA